MDHLLGACAPWIKAWNLTPDGEAFETEYTHSILLPVRHGAKPYMLKIASTPEEIRGLKLMTWWDGDGAAQVVAQQGTAILLERAKDLDSLAEMSRRRDDENAIRILNKTLDRLHKPRSNPRPSNFPSLALRFQSATRAKATNSLLQKGFAVADELLARPQDEVLLHGDMHHENVLYFGDRGWLAIDPNGLIGERGYDYANIFRNPDRKTALAPGRFDSRLAQISRGANLDPTRVLLWVIAHAALSSAWSVEDGHSPEWSLAVLEVALSKLPSFDFRRLLLGKKP